MKKQLLSAGIMAAVTGSVYAQTNVTIYGIVDTGVMKETGSDVKMGEWNDSRIGFKGTEDLGNGYKATFQLEQRLDMNDGTAGTPEWDGASNVGLSGPFGRIRLGRMNEIETESFRRLDPFNQEGVGSMMKGTQRTSRISNVARYDSPSLYGFSASLGYYLGENTKNVDKSSDDNKFVREGADNDGFALGLNYNSDSWMLLANFSRLSDSNKSNVWSVGAAYKFSGFKVGLGFERTDDKGWKFGSTSKESKQNNWILAGEYKTGPHKIAGAFSWLEVRDYHGFSDDDNRDVKKYSLGYFYSLSKRTTLYGQVAYSDFEDKEIANFFKYYTDGVAGVQLGINHKF